VSAKSAGGRIVDVIDQALLGVAKGRWRERLFALFRCVPTIQHVSGHCAATFLAETIQNVAKTIRTYIVPQQIGTIVLLLTKSS
jgi:hypothetical protein